MGLRRGLRSTSIRPCSIWRGGSGVRARKGWPGGASRTTSQTAMVASAVKTTAAPNTARQPMACEAQASGVVAAKLPSRPMDRTMAVRVEKRSGGNQREITTMLPMSMTPKPAPISTRPVSRIGQVGARVKMMPPMVARMSMPTTVRRGPKRSKKKPQGICMAAKPKKKAPVSPPRASGPMARSRIRSRPMVTLEARKKWLAT